jgi:ribosomal protein L37AE/L43A
VNKQRVEIHGKTFRIGRCDLCEDDEVVTVSREADAGWFCEMCNAVLDVKAIATAMTTPEVKSKKVH